MLSFSAFALSACGSKPQEHRTTLLAFGTLVSITLWDVDEAKANKAMATINEDLAFMHDAWHAWKPGPMGRMNQLLETTAEFSANPSVLPLIIKAQQLSAQSEGLFNPSIGRLVDLWGFHRDDPSTASPPSQAHIDRLLKQNPQMADIEINQVRIRSRNPAVKLDMGGMAKGFAVEHTIDYLKSIDIQNAIVNAGGDLKAIGRHGKRAWRVGIQHPREEDVIATLDVYDGESVFTSGDYERYYEHAGKRYHHIIDPRTGYPADGAASVTVIYPDAEIADAAATALFVAGPDKWRSIAKAIGIKHVLLIDKNGHIHISPEMAKRIRFAHSPHSITSSAAL